MGNSFCRKVTVPVGETLSIPVSLGPRQTLLQCMSRNTAITTCSVRGSTLYITGRRPGSTLVVVIFGYPHEPVGQLIYLVDVIEENEE